MVVHLWSQGIKISDVFIVVSLIIARRCVRQMHRPLPYVASLDMSLELVHRPRIVRLLGMRLALPKVVNVCDILNVTDWLDSFVTSVARVRNAFLACKLRLRDFALIANETSIDKESNFYVIAIQHLFETGPRVCWQRLAGFTFPRVQLN